MRTIVVSAVNLKVGGTLAILRDCLHYLSELAATEHYRIVAVVYSKELAYFPGVEYIETQWPKKRWVNRLWYEYVSLKKVSKQVGPVYLWLSLHDTSPSVVAERRAVYCHNSFSFYKWSVHDLFFAPKIALFAIFTKYIYRTNIKRNDYVVVQQQWFKKAMTEMFGISPSRIVVTPPKLPELKVEALSLPETDEFLFLFPGMTDSHKNFEVLCKAAEILEKKYKMYNFSVCITLKGNENKYSRWLHKRWGGLRSIRFLGYLDKASLFGYYERADCLVFPSKVETWGLPISEFAAYGKPMLLTDLPYAHETAAGNGEVAFFDPDDAEVLAGMMKNLIGGDRSFLKEVPGQVLEKPVAPSWPSLFSILLADK